MLAQDDSPLLLTKKATALLLGVSQGKVLELVAEGLVHQPARLGPQTVRWSAEQLRRDIERMMTEPLEDEATAAARSLEMGRRRREGHARKKAGG